MGFFSFLDVTELTPLGRFSTVGYRLKKHRFLFEWKLPSPQCGHDDYLAFWHRCDRIMFYRISGAALYIFGEDGFSVPLSQRSFFFQFFRGFEMLLVLHNHLRHVNL